MQGTEAYEDLVPVPRAALRLPLELPLPPGFDPERLDTWPRVSGRLEFVDGRLLYMPPTGDVQADTSADVVGLLHSWRRSHRELEVGGNEAGMMLAGAIRAADAAVWRASDLAGYTEGLRRCAPVLAVAVAGKYDEEAGLRVKADWYLQRGVQVVWLLFPAETKALVMTPGGEVVCQSDDRIPEHPGLPGLAPLVRELFEQAREPAAP